MLRKLIEDLTAGTPDYARMSPALAAATRASLPSMQKELTGFGPLSTLALERVNPDGAAIYRVSWKQAAGDAGILLGPNGTIDGAYFERDDD